MLVTLLIPIALAYESDQLTPRQAPPPDVTAAANATANRLLAEAVEATRTPALCLSDDDTLRRALAREVHRVMGRTESVNAQGVALPLRFGAYAAWLEQEHQAVAVRAPRRDIYSEVRLGENVLLRTFGPASTLSLGGQLVGTDKIDHFWVQGYDYFRVSRGGQDTQRAVDWGTGTELGIWGQATTGVFSYADLEANYAGYRFYTSLLAPGGVVQRDETGCATQARTFDWREWVNPGMDEVLNPSVYVPELASPILRELNTLPQCHDPDLLSAPEREALQRALAGSPAVGAGAPPRDSSLDLSDLCAPIAMALADAEPDR